MTGNNKEPNLQHTTPKNENSHKGKRTLIEIAGFPPPLGSWSLRVEFLAEKWQKSGFNCTLMNIGSSRKLKNPKYLNIKGIIDFIAKVTIFAAKGNIIHTHTNAKGVKGTMLALIGQCISIPFGMHSVLTFHAGVNQHYFPKTGRFWIDLLMKLTFKTPRAIICNSQNVKDRISKDYQIPDEKIYPIPAFCAAYMKTELGVLSGEVEEFARKHSPLLVSYVYFYHPEFTVDMMIKGVEKLRSKFPNLGLIIMGSTQYAENYDSLIKERNLGDHILKTGNLPRGEFLAVLKRSTLYLRTPMGDGVAASVLEALSLKIPVVTVDNGTRPPSCILYQPEDLEDMVKKVIHVIKNRDKVISEIVKPDDKDTLEDEVKLLASV